MQQASCPRNQVSDFEGFHQVRDIAILEENADLALFQPVGEGKQQMGIHAWTILLDPGVSLFCIPVSRHLSVHDYGIEVFREQTGFDIRALGRGHHVRACPRQDVPLKLEDSLFLFQQQHSSLNSALPPRRRSCLARWGRSRLRCNRQAYLDNRPSSSSIVRGNVASMFLHNAVTDAEPQPSPLAHALSGIEGIKNAFGILHAWPIIGELCANMAVLAKHADLEFAGASGFKNGINRIVDDVKKYLLDLMRIGNDKSGFRRRVFFYADVIDFEIVVAQRQSFVQHLPDVDFFTLRFALACE